VSTMPETQHYAFFDVDGTVIARDSFRILMREMLLKGTRWRMALAALLCLLIAPLRLIGLADKTQFKSAFLWSATVGRSLRDQARGPGNRQPSAFASDALQDQRHP